MRDKKRTFEDEIQIKSNYSPTVTMEFGKLFFEIGIHLTDDVVEGVVLLMYAQKVPNDIWNIKLNKNLEVSPIKSLYWITGGDSVWGINKNRITGWGICGGVFGDEFGDVIIDIVRNSVTLGDLRDGLISRIMYIRTDINKYYKYCQ
jgi:hypothetical protein